MKLKNEVKIVDSPEYIVLYRKIKKIIPDTDQYLIEALTHGVEKEDELVKIIMKYKHINEAAACLDLADFIVKYGAFLDYGNLSRIIEE